MKTDAGTQDFVEDFLSHFGVKGMRWGQRRAASRTARADKKFEEQASSISTKIDIHNSVNDRMNNYHIPRINSKPEYVKAANDGLLANDNHPIAKKYFKEYTDVYISEMNMMASTVRNRSGTRQYAVKANDYDALGFTVYTKDVKHDNDTFKVKFVKDSQGRIIDFVLDELEQGSLFVRKILKHYGVLGMKWGRRSTSPSVSVVQKRKKLKTSGGEGRKAHSDAVRTAKIGQVKKKSGVAAISDKDLNAYANRLQLEQRVKGLEYNQKSAPRKFIQNLLGNSGKQYANQLSGEATNVAAKRTIAVAAKRAAKTAAVG